MQPIAFRHLLTQGVRAYLDAMEMGADDTADAVSEIIVSLGRYREEGTALFPLVFVAESIHLLLGGVAGDDPVTLGEGPRSAETVRLALKRAAGLCVGRHWAIFFVLTEPASMRFGVFRIDPFPLRPSPLERLVSHDDKHLRVLAISQRGEAVVELRASGDRTKHVYLSGHAPQAEAPTRPLDELSEACAQDAAPDVQKAVREYYRRVFAGMMQEDHGSLVAVAKAQSSLSPHFADGVLFREPIDVAGQIRAFRHRPEAVLDARVRALAVLTRGMILSDGVTVLASDGSIIGYSVFLRHEEGLQIGPVVVGGARRRTFEALSAWLGRGLVATFYRSQDGALLCRRDRSEASFPAKPSHS